jgi:hypothetical protein
MYIATHEAGVLKTADGGQTWFEVNTGLRGHDVHGLAIDPNASEKLHALTTVSLVLNRLLLQLPAGPRRSRLLFHEA